MIAPTDLENLLASSANRDPVELIEEIARIAGEIGEDACDALLASNPELLKYAPALTQANRQRVQKQENEETDRMLQRRLNGPVELGPLLGKTGRRDYDRVSDMFQNIDFNNCPAGDGWLRPESGNDFPGS